MSDHPNDAIQFAQYPDGTLRDSYPRAITRGGNANAVASDAVLSVALSRLPTPLPDLPVPVSEAPKLPDDPELDGYKAAGWVLG